MHFYDYFVREVSISERGVVGLGRRVQKLESSNTVWISAAIMLFMFQWKAWVYISLRVVLLWNMIAKVSSLTFTVNGLWFPDIFFVQTQLVIVLAYEQAFPKLK